MRSEVLKPCLDRLDQWQNAFACKVVSSGLEKLGLPKPHSGCVHPDISVNISRPARINLKLKLHLVLVMHKRRLGKGSSESSSFHSSVLSRPLTVRSAMNNAHE
jgi:hypothetical protein